jgi:hypothetical protein
MNRWSPPSFDGEPAASNPTPGRPLSDPSRLLDDALAVLPSVNEVDAIRGKAYQDAYARGLQEGLLEGHAQGAAKGREEGMEQGRAEVQLPLPRLTIRCYRKGRPWPCSSLSRFGTRRCCK